MGVSNERIREALSAYLEYFEMGGSEPETSHLNLTERDELKRLVDGLRLTEGVPFGVGRGEHEEQRSDDSPPSRVSRLRGGNEPDLTQSVVVELRETLPFDARIDLDPVDLIPQVDEFEILGRWVVGTFGGRIRVWLLDVTTAERLEETTAILGDLDRVFRSLPDTAAIALVAADLTCLLVEPEDCAPKIQVPEGSLIARRYQRPLQPLSEALHAFMNELVPYWDPVPQFQQDAGLVIDAMHVSDEFVRTAVQDQVAIGQRARKGNPKKDALLALGAREVAGLKKIADQLLKGDIKPSDVEARLETLAKKS